MARTIDIHDALIGIEQHAAGTREAQRLHHLPDLRVAREQRGQFDTVVRQPTLGIEDNALQAEA